MYHCYITATLGLSVLLISDILSLVN
jgi:hypothetical protein